MKKSILSLIIFISILNISLFASSIVIDSNTKLQWQDDYSDNGGNIKSATWADAISYCENSSLGDYTDWRLPNKNELLSLVDYGKYNPSIDTNKFTNVGSSYCWSSTTGADYSDSAWVVDFDDGYTNGNGKSSTNYVRCVRAGQFENFELKNIGLLSETPKDYEIKTSSFTKSWTFSEDISAYDIEVVSNTYNYNGTFSKNAKVLSVDLSANTSIGTNKIVLKLKDSNNKNVLINGSDTFWAVSKTNNAPRLADGQITQLVSATNESAFLDISTFDADGDNVSMYVYDANGGYVGFDSENQNRIIASFSDGKTMHTIKIALNDGKEEVIKDFIVLQFNSSSIQSFYSDVDANHSRFKDIAFGTLEGVFVGQINPSDTTKRIFRPDDDASMAEVLAMIMQAAKKIGKIELLSSQYYLSAYPSWVMPYYTYAKEIGAIDDIGDDLSVVYPTKEQIARILVKVLNLDEYSFLYENLNYSFDNEAYFTSPIYKRYANITKLFGFLFVNSYEDPSLMMSRAEIASLVSKIFMMPKAQIVTPENIEYADSFDINIENIQAKRINSNYQLENNTNVTTNYAINKTILNSNPVNSIDLNVGANQILAVVNNDGVKNVLLGNVDIVYTDKDGDGSQDTNDKWPEDPRYYKDDNNNGIPDILDTIYNLSNLTASDNLVIGNQSYAISDIIRDGEYTPSITYSWDIKEWSQCQGTCGTNNAVQTRVVSCKSSQGSLVSDSMCNISTKPIITQSCTQSLCNQTPIAKAGVDQTLEQGISVTLDARNSIDSDGTIVSYEWKEGNTILSTNSVFSKSNFLVGTHTITLTVIDDMNQSSTDIVVITITNPSVVSSPQEQFIERFYQNIMNRTADEGGMATWLDVIQNESATKVALGFFKSQEFINKDLSNPEFVDILYQTLFDREADYDGRTDWLNKLNNNLATKDEVMYGFFNAQEFANLANRFGVTQIRAEDQLNTGTTGVDGYVNRFYDLVLNRTADDSGFTDWTTQLNAGTKGGGDIAKGFFNSQEYLNRGLDNSTFLDICYKAFFDRDADEGGKSNWTTLLDQGASTDTVLDGFIDSEEFINLANTFGISNRL